MSLDFAPPPAPPASVHVVRVLEVRHYTDSLFAFTCERPTSLRFRSGEFVMIGLMNGERPLLRAYSIASPAWDETLSFYSIKAPNGPLTTKLQKVQPGDHILIGKKPTGTLVLDALTPGKRLFLLSTGTGIAPFVSLIREPETYERYDEVILTHTCRTAAELDYGAEIVAAALADPLVGEEAQAKLRYVTSLTRDPHPLQGRITTLIENGGLFKALGAPGFDPATDRIMICGSVPMLNDCKALSLAHGFVEGSNHEPGSFVVERAFAA
ncbi:MAG: ferredoxin--NADP reductase [Hyphomonadaceae bacterium]|nr:ferredoxin--NADP reductase [Hyphomonadaceae bacterium]